MDKGFPTVESGPFAGCRIRAALSQALGNPSPLMGEVDK